MPHVSSHLMHRSVPYTRDQGRGPVMTRAVGPGLHLGGSQGWGGDCPLLRDLLPLTEFLLCHRVGVFPT